MSLRDLLLRVPMQAKVLHFDSMRCFGWPQVPVRRRCLPHSRRSNDAGNVRQMAFDFGGEIPVVSARIGCSAF